MYISFYSLLPLLFVSLVICRPFSQNENASNPAYFILAGDSTTAVQSAGGGGWGDGFLNDTLKSPAKGVNKGRNGATTVSFRAGGDWATVLSLIRQYKSAYDVYVTLQWGHNDQKATANISVAEYTQNLIGFAKEAKSAGGVPIHVTPLTRRTFKGASVVQDLEPQRLATISAAKNTSSRYMDLNLASTNYVNDIGATAAAAYNLVLMDFMHLNYRGSVVFGRMVSDLMVDKYADIATWTAKNATLTALICKGIAA